MDATAVIAMIGGIALLLGIFGGGIKAKEVEIPLIPPFVRILSGSTGIILLGVTVWLSIRSSAATVPERNSSATPAYPTLLETTVSATNVPTQNGLRPTDSPTPIFTNVPPTNTPVEISTSGSANWAFALEYRLSDGFWAAGERWYSLSWTCSDAAPVVTRHNFTVSTDFPLLPGDVYLQSSALRAGSPWGGLVDGINPYQSTVLSVLWDKITKSEADSRASDCIGKVTIDSGAIAILTGKLFQH